MTNKKIILKTFISFLKKNNVLNEYYVALKHGEDYRFGYAQNKHCLDENEFIVEYVKKNPSLLIMDAFRWSNSNETCWSILHDNWFKLCKSRNFK